MEFIKFSQIETRVAWSIALLRWNIAARFSFITGLRKGTGVAVCSIDHRGEEVQLHVIYSEKSAEIALKKLYH